MATTPTSMVNRLMGLETWTDAVNFGTGAHIFGGVPLFGTVALPVPGTAPIVAVAAATTTLTLTAALHANRIVSFTSTGGLAITPPAATGTGNVYTLMALATVTGGSVTIDAKAGNGSDLFFGCAHINLLATGVTIFATLVNSNLYTANGTTTGGNKGDLITMVDVALHVWNIFVNGQGTGTIATPFSNH